MMIIMMVIQDQDGKAFICLHGDGNNIFTLSSAGSRGEVYVYIWPFTPGKLVEEPNVIFTIMLHRICLFDETI